MWHAQGYNYYHNVDLGPIYVPRKQARVHNNSGPELAFGVKIGPIYVEILYFFNYFN